MFGLPECSGAAERSSGIVPFGVARSLMDERSERDQRRGAREVQRAEKLNSLTSMRFVAAAMIVVHHSRGNFGIPLDAGGRFLLDQAVSFFFVLSGFILTYVYPRLDTWETRPIHVAPGLGDLDAPHLPDSAIV